MKPTKLTADERAQVTATLRTPRWILLSLLVLVLSVAFALLSNWQWNRATSTIEADRAATQEPAALAQLQPDALVAPSAVVGRMAEVSGVYRENLRIGNRLAAHGERGDWIVSGLDDGSGRLVAVLRGWVPTGSAVPEQSDPVTVLGRIHTDQNFYSGAGNGGPPQVITNDALAQYWRQPVRQGYLVLDGQIPELTASDPQPVPPVFGVDEGVGIPWQNLGYALQWIIFIAFVAFIWLRWFREDVRDAAARNQPSQTSALSAAGQDPDALDSACGQGRRNLES